MRAAEEGWREHVERMKALESARWKGADGTDVDDIAA